MPIHKRNSGQAVKLGGDQNSGTECVVSNSTTSPMVHYHRSSALKMLRSE